jgi:hypothetical protein
MVWGDMALLSSSCPTIVIFKSASFLPLRKMKKEADCSHLFVTRGLAIHVILSKARM